MRNSFRQKWRKKFCDPPLVTELSLLPFDAQALLDVIRETLFPEVTSRPLVVFGEMEWLAFIYREPKNHDAPVISLHSVLNHPQTPPEVIRFIFCHELIHITHPPREVDGETDIHPPEFWERERKLCPDAYRSWAWIYLHYLRVLRKDTKQQGMRVKMRRDDRRMYYSGRTRLSVEEAVALWYDSDEHEKKKAETPAI